MVGRRPEDERQDRMGGLHVIEQCSRRVGAMINGGLCSC